MANFLERSCDINGILWVFDHPKGEMERKREGERRDREERVETAGSRQGRGDGSGASSSSRPQEGGGRGSGDRHKSSWAGAQFKALAPEIRTGLLLLRLYIYVAVLQVWPFRLMSSCSLRLSLMVSEGSPAPDNEA